MSFVNSCLTTCPNSVLGKLGSTLVAIGGLCDAGVALFTSKGGALLLKTLSDVYKDLRRIAV
jgi:hypothetical protein